MPQIYRNTKCVELFLDLIYSEDNSDTVDLVMRDKHGNVDCYLAVISSEGIRLVSGLDSRADIGIEIDSDTGTIKLLSAEDTED